MASRIAELERQLAAANRRAERAERKLRLASSPPVLYLKDTLSGTTKKLTGNIKRYLQMEFGRKRVKKLKSLRAPVQQIDQQHLITTRPPGRTNIKASVVISMWFIISEDFELRNTSLFYDGVNNPAEINEEVLMQMADYLADFGFSPDEVATFQQVPRHILEYQKVHSYSYEVIGTATDAVWEPEGAYLRENIPLDLCNPTIEYFYPTPNKDPLLSAEKQWVRSNCAWQYLDLKLRHDRKRQVDIPIEELDELVDLPTDTSQGGAKVENIYHFCKDRKIRFICWEIDGTIRFNYMPKNYNKRYCTIKIMAWDNHLYPVLGSYVPNTPEPTKYRIVDNAMDKIQKKLKKHYAPTNVKLTSAGTVQSFDCNGISYIENDQYESCLKIGKIFDIEDKVTASTTLSSMVTLIEYKFMKDNNIKAKDSRSFWPGSCRYTISGLRYVNPSHAKTPDNLIKTIDQNKCFPSHLESLDYLIVLNATRSRPITNRNEIVDCYIYRIKVKSWTSLLPTSGIYTGYHLRYCINLGIKFRIEEGWSTTTVPNYYKDLVKLIFDKCDSADAKMMMVSLIGRMQRGDVVRNVSNFTKVANQDELKRTGGYNYPIDGTDYSIVYSRNKLTNSVYTKKPIAMQVIESSMRAVYEQTVRMGLTPEDIVQIKVDAISYIADRYEPEEDEFTSRERGKWKWEPFNRMKYSDKFDNPAPPMEFVPPDMKYIWGDGQDKPLPMLPQDLEDIVRSFLGWDQVTECTLGNAGNGKTHYILNTLIPSFGTAKYLIMTPCNLACDVYRQKGINCAVTQTFLFSGTLPKENVLAIDEFGLCDDATLAMLYACRRAGKSIYCFGDFTQLLPVNCDTQLDGQMYMKAMFTNMKIMNQNWRNNATPEYYDWLRKLPRQEAQRQVKKFSTPWQEAEHVICWTNETRRRYNRMIAEHKGVEFMQPGCLVICRKNSKTLHKYEVYNGSRFTVAANDGRHVTMTNGKVLPRRICTAAAFDFGYALTAYCIQGSSVSSYHFPDEDITSINARRAYTIISRLKGHDFDFAESS